MELEEIMDYERLQRSGIKCCRGGRWKASIQSFEMTLARTTARSRRRVINHTYIPGRTNDFEITERGKRRLIRAHLVQDRQIFKSFCDYELKPAIANYILDHNNASQVGKGTDRAIKQFRQGLAKAYRKYGRDFYVVTYDYHNYFGTLDHDIIKRNIPVSESSYYLLDAYVDIFERIDHTYAGIGIGGEPSQDISVAYCSKIHRAIAGDPHVIDAGWYMDDGYIITHTKDEARNALTRVIALSDKYHLQINFKRTKINWMEKDTVLWLKKRTHLTPSGKIIMKLVPGNIKDQIMRINEYKYMIDKGWMPQEPADISIMCWMTYSKPYNSNYQRLRVLRHYCNKFNIPWNTVRPLLRRSPKGWIESRRSNI